MQQFTVPQFIDVEDKIIGPITARQFVIMLAGALVIAIFYKVLDFTAFLFAGFMVFVVCGVLAFFKVNGMPFHFFILNFFQTFSRPNKRIWNNQMQKYQLQEEIVAAAPLLPPSPAKVYGRSRLTELSLIVDTRGAYRGEDNSEPANFKPPVIAKR